MLGHLHHVARCLRLALACLVLAGASVSAHALPSAEAAVAVSIDRRVPAAQHRSIEVPARVRAAPPGGFGALERVGLASSAREAHAPSPPRRLFLLHRALLH
jgi:hypothetical protein